MVSRLSDEELLEDLLRVAEECSANVTIREYDEKGEYHSNTIKAHFETWNKAKKRAGLPCNSFKEEQKRSYEQVVQLVMTNIKIDTETGCWEWKRWVQPNGYGVLWIEDKVWGVHRLMHIIHNGALSSEEIVCHTCDNPSCVNPDHLWSGTHKDNMQDAMQKGRAIKGERVPSAKLTKEEVLEIREKYSSSDISQRDLADQYSLTKSTIGDIVREEIWTHL